MNKIRLIVYPLKQKHPNPSVDYQRPFLEKGIRYLRPLTRAEVATRLGLDEGTISRATANKYVLLPNGRHCRTTIF